MFTAKALNDIIESFLLNVQSSGYVVERAVLFGSYAKGKPHKYSDIDIAVWLNNLPEKHYTEIPELLHIVALHHPVQPKFYAASEAADSDPFIKIIEDNGKEISLPVKHE